MKLSAVDDPSFSSAIAARDVLYGLLALKARDVRPRRSFHVMKLECLRPSAEMLASLEVNATAPVVAMPPFYDAEPFEAAIRQGNGQFSFTADNEVPYFRDKMESDRCVTCNDHTLFVLLNSSTARSSAMKSAPTVWTSVKSLKLYSSSVHYNNPMVVSRSVSY